MVRSTILAHCGGNFQFFPKIIRHFFFYNKKNRIQIIKKSLMNVNRIFNYLKGRNALSFLGKNRKFWPQWDPHCTALLLSSKESLVNFKNKTFPQLLKLFRRLIQKLDSLKTTANSLHNQIQVFDISKLKRTSCLNVALDNILT